LIVQELVEGKSIFDEIISRGSEFGVEGLFKSDEMQRISTPILETLEEFRRKGFIHGDIKSENIMLTSDMLPKLADFGLSHDAADIVRQTTYSYSYRSPERILNKQRTTQDDVWALGCTLYEAYTGLQLFNMEGSIDKSDDTMKGLLNLMEQKIGRKIPKSWIEASGKRYSYFDYDRDSKTYSLKKPFLEDLKREATSIRDDIMAAAVEKGDDLLRADRLADVIEQMVTFNDRLRPCDLLRLPFFKGEGE
jgi:serine/threonine protein kinase